MCTAGSQVVLRGTVKLMKVDDTEDLESYGEDEPFVYLSECTSITNFTMWRAYHSFFKAVLYFIVVLASFLLYVSDLTCAEQESVKSSIFWIGFSNIIALVLELCSGITRTCYSSMHYNEFAALSRFQRTQVAILKVLPSILSLVHTFSLIVIIYSWAIYAADSAFCQAAETEFMDRFLILIAANTVGWVVLLFLGTFFRRTFKDNDVLYYPPYETGTTCCFIDLTCASYNHLPPPRCCIPCYSYARPSHDPRDPDTCTSAAIKYVGECFFRFFKGIATLLLFYKRNKSEIAP